MSVTAVALLGILAAASPAIWNGERGTTSPSFAEAGAVPIPESAYFGTHFSSSVSDRRGALSDLEDGIDRTFAVDHVYHRWGSEFPGPYDRWTIAQGRTLFLNWTSRSDSGAAAKWAEITAGRWDALIDRRARDVAALEVPVLMGFTHEPGPLIGDRPWHSGNEREYIAAWRYIVDRFARAGANNVSWVWTLTAYEFRAGAPERFYPGDDVIDWIGVDGYVNVSCPWLDVPWQSWTDVFGPAHDFAQRRHKPLVVAEFGLAEDPQDPSRKKEWLVDSSDEIEQMEYLKAVVSFNSEEPCSSYIASSPAALDGYRVMGSSPGVEAPSPSAS